MNSNLPPGVTDRMIEEQAGAFDDEPKIAAMSNKSLIVDDDMGYRTSVTMIYGDTCLSLRRAVRELHMGAIPIYSPYDCTGLICNQTCKFLKVYRTYAGSYVGIIEIHTARDV